MFGWLISNFVLQVKLHPVKHRPGNHPGNVILSQEPKLQVADKSQFCIIFFENFVWKKLLCKSSKLCMEQLSCILWTWFINGVSTTGKIPGRCWLLRRGVDLDWGDMLFVEDLVSLADQNVSNPLWTKCRKSHQFVAALYPKLSAPSVRTGPLYWGILSVFLIGLVGVRLTPSACRCHAKLATAWWLVSKEKRWVRE
jgi:hypothetical protein